MEKDSLYVGLRDNIIEDICIFWSKEKPASNFFDKGFRYIISDIHGDMNSLLHFLIKSGFATFKKDEPVLVKRKFCNDLEITIPNLQINRNFNGKLFILGDLIDRGIHSKQCFFLVKYLINEAEIIVKENPEIKADISYLFGNHEASVLLGDFEGSVDNGWVGSSKDFSEVREELIDTFYRNKINIADEIGSGIIGSHIAFGISNVVKIFDFLRECRGSQNFKKLLDKYEHIEIDAISHKLNEKDFLHFINIFGRYTLKVFIKLGVKPSHHIFSTLFFDRTKKKHNNDNICGIFQCVGHEPLATHKPFVSLNRIYLDCLQSSGFHENKGLSFPTFITFDGMSFSTMSFAALKGSGVYNTYPIQSNYVIPNFFLEKIDKKIAAGFDLDDCELNILNTPYFSTSISNYNILKYMISNPRIKINNVYKESSIIFSVFNLGKEDLIKDLLAREDLKLLTPNFSGETVFDSIFARQPQKIRTLMLEHPSVNINYRNRYGKTILHRIIDLCDEESLKIVLKNDNLVLTEDDAFVDTPLVYAVKKVEFGVNECKAIVSDILGSRKLNIEKELKILDDKFDLETSYILENKYNVTKSTTPKATLTTVEAIRNNVENGTMQRVAKNSKKMCSFPPILSCKKEKPISITNGVDIDGKLGCCSNRANRDNINLEHQKLQTFPLCSKKCKKIIDDKGWGGLSI